MSYIVQNKEDFEQELEEAGNKLIIIDFFANWCGPCKMINPKLEELSLQYANKAKILKVNVDDCDEIAMEFNITSMPTFVLMKDQRVVDVCVGGNTEKLINKIEKYVSAEDLTPKNVNKKSVGSNVVNQSQLDVVNLQTATTSSYEPEANAYVVDDQQQQQQPLQQQQQQYEDLQGGPTNMPEAVVDEEQ